MATETKEKPASGSPADAAGAANPFKWFAVQTYSSFENKVKQGIEHRSALEGMEEGIRRVVIPTETVIEIKNGKKRSIQRSLMPGYVLVEMLPTEDLFNLIKEVKGVAAFVGDGVNASALTEQEVGNLLNIMEDKQDKPKPKVSFRKGDQIKVIEGPFTNFTGSVEAVDDEKGKLTVMVSIFGRPTPVELDVLQVEGT